MHLSTTMLSTLGRITLNSLLRFLFYVLIVFYPPLNQKRQEKSENRSAVRVKKLSFVLKLFKIVEILYGPNVSERNLLGGLSDINACNKAGH